MRTVDEYLADCLAVAEPLPPFTVILDDAVGCIVAEDVRSLVDVPQADLSGRDGYAVRVADLAGATRENPVKLPVLEEIRADNVTASSLIPGACVQISSGAVLPRGTQAVVPIEWTDQGRAEVQIYGTVTEGDNIRCQAEDLAAGEVILAAGVRIGSRQIALLASAGHSRVLVHPAPRVVIIAIGDELQEPGMAAAHGKIFDANSHALATAVRDTGGTVYRVGSVSDDKRELRELLEDQVVRADVIITTGGLSYGGGDTLKEVLSPLGSIRFDNVAMNPGRQVGVGKLDDATIFCLPGSPVAAWTSFEVFVRPVLRKMAGHTHIFRRSIPARVLRGWDSPAGEQEYVLGIVAGNPTDGYRVEPAGDPQRPLLSGMSDANCLVVVPAEHTTVAVGDVLECMVLNR